MKTFGELMAEELWGDGYLVDPEGDNGCHTIDSLQQEVAQIIDQQRPCGCEKLKEAAQAFVDRLKVIHDDPLYQTIWFSAANHGIDYSNGPKYDKELESLADALAQPCQHQEREHKSSPVELIGDPLEVELHRQALTTEAPSAPVEAWRDLTQQETKCGQLTEKGDRLVQTANGYIWQRRVTPKS